MVMMDIKYGAKILLKKWYLVKDISKKQKIEFNCLAVLTVNWNLVLGTDTETWFWS